MDVEVISPLSHDVAVAEDAQDACLDLSFVAY